MMWQRWRLPGLALLLVLVTGAGLGLGYWAQSARLARLSPPSPGPEAAPEAVQPADSRPQTWPEGVTVVTAATEVVLRTTYLKCGETREQVLTADDSVVGLSMEGLRRFHPDWTVISFTPERLVARAVKDAWCPDLDPAEMERYRTIGIDDGKVTVFWGKPGPHRPVKEVTPFPADSLSPADRALLEKGYTVEGDEAVLQYLEGLAE